MRLNLLSGSYFARSPIASAQRCINYFPERNPKDSPVPMTFYQRPGFRPVAQGPIAPVRGLYRASTGIGYCAIGQNIYQIGVDFNLTLLGTMDVPAFTPAEGPVRMIDNATSMMIVDGSNQGYTVDLATGTFGKIVDHTGAFVGANVVDYLDTFMIWNSPGSNLFGSTLSNQLAFDALYVAGKAGYPDKLQSLIVNRRQIMLFGTLKSEIWYNAGNPLFPFAELPGTYIEHGCIAPYSVAAQDVDVYWLGQDHQGVGVVFLQRGYETKRISNHALDFAIQNMILHNQDVTGAIGYTYQAYGHVFYVLTFPVGNQTWVYDATIGDPMLAWSQRAWSDEQGNLNRDRSNCHAYINNTNIVGDWQNGTLYALDHDYYVDTVNGRDYGIDCVRSFPHVFIVMGPQGQPMGTEGHICVFREFRLDLDVGSVPLDAAGQPAQIWLRTSLDRGKTYGNAVFQPGGAPGQYLTQPKWGNVGTGRDVVFEIGHSIAGPAPLQGAWVQVDVGGN